MRLAAESGSRGVAGAVSALAWLWCAGAGFAQTPSPSPPPVRAVFVGINHYAHSIDNDKKTPGVDPTFHDLQGAVADVALMKTTLRTAYGLDLDPGVPALGVSCASSNAVSITLTETCATRRAILGALTGQIVASPPGGFVLFYFAGHGSTHPDATHTQVTGDNDTIVPSDARAPGVEPNDILDVELNAVIEQAVARGVNVVTIFDSCHSGTATRDVVPGFALRSAPPPSATTPHQQSAPPQLPSGVVARSPGYRVHIAASGDAEEAHETVRDKEHHGVFTLALTDTLAQRKGATYYDITQETRWRLQQSGHNPALRLGAALKFAVQTSQEEGELTAPFLGAKPVLRREYAAHADDPAAKTLHLDVGTLSGVSLNSTFAVYASAQAAQTDPKATVASGYVSDVEPGAATIALTTPLQALAPPAVVTDAFLAATASRDFWVRELTHDYGAPIVNVEIDGGDASARKQVSDALAALGGTDSFVKIVTSDPNFTVAIKDGKASFLNADRVTVYDAGPVVDPAFADRLGDVVLAAANYIALISLRDDNGKAWGRVAVCPKDAVLATCPPENAAVVIPPSDVDMWLMNKRGDQDLHRYALFLDSTTYEISVIAPPPNGDDLLPANTQQKFFAGTYLRPGRGTVLVFLTTRPINVAALRQDPVRDVDSAARNGLERRLFYAAAGQRETAMLRTGDWGALAIDVTVVNPPAKP